MENESFVMQRNAKSAEALRAGKGEPQGKPIERMLKNDGGLMIDLISLIDSPKCSPGTGLFMIQNWVAGQRRLAIPAPIPAPASPHQHGGQISTEESCQVDPHCWDSKG